MQSSFTDQTYRGYEVHLRIARQNTYLQPVTLRTPLELYNFMRELGDESAEHVYAVLTDAKRRVQGVYLAGKGGINHCNVDEKEVFKAALVTNSPSFSIVHNHPSGIVEPSNEDIALINKIDMGARLLGLELFDSLIIADGRYLSFHEIGSLPRRGS